MTTLGSNGNSAAPGMCLVGGEGVAEAAAPSAGAALQGEVEGGGGGGGCEA